MTFDFDKALSNPENEVLSNIQQFVGLDEYKEKRIMTTFKPKAVNADDKLFIVFVKPNRMTIIFTLDEVYDKTTQYLVHAEDIAEFSYEDLIIGSKEVIELLEEVSANGNVV
jgi:hypothetical protein